MCRDCSEKTKWVIFLSYKIITFLKKSITTNHGDIALASIHICCSTVHTWASWTNIADSQYSRAELSFLCSIRHLVFSPRPIRSRLATNSSSSTPAIDGWMHPPEEKARRLSGVDVEERTNATCPLHRWGTCWFWILHVIASPASLANAQARTAIW